MIFSSFLFLWCFLPPLLILYFSVKSPVYRNVLLLIASLIFYAWGEPYYVFLMMASVTANYFLGQWVGGASTPKMKKTAVLIGTLINLLILAHFKYTDFLIDNLNILLSLEISAKEIPLPIGISFYTFQAISYLVDIYRGEVKPQRNFIKMGLYIAFFPQMVAGPIIKYH
ncbi:MAG: MBOAT family protein, partial [Alphaproteobacteria bacterium]